MSLGMDANSGRWISDIDHLRQSVRKILTTPIGTRVERREFGSLVPDLIDSPVTDRFNILVYAAVATALMHHEPRIRLERVNVDVSSGTRPVVTISGTLVLDDSMQRVHINVEV